LEARQLLSVSANIGVGIGDLVTPPGQPADTVAPTAEIAKPDNIKTAGAAEGSVTVEYSDDVALDLTNKIFAAGDISITGSENRVLQVLTATTVAGDDGRGEGDTTRTVKVVYTFAAADGTWDHLDNGTYTVLVNPGIVSDLSGNL